LPIDNVWVMPEGTSTAGLNSRSQQLADAVLARGLNLTTRRLHILIWGAERGR
jgi:7-carboxy-7-deazaguanine synthase